MPKKIVVVLANSTKKSGHCVAGKEIISESDGYYVRGWVRPLSKNGWEGELNTFETRKSNGHQVQIFDFVRMDLPKHVGTTAQPENWLMGEQWEDLNDRFAKPPFSLVEDKSDDIWLDPSRKSDRASQSFINNNPPESSLLLIRPKNLAISLYTDDWGKERNRALFEYNGEHYDLGLTDPIFESKYCRNIPAKGRGRNNFKLPCGDKCALCVSLTAPFSKDNNHYKVVATVFENV